MTPVVVVLDHLEEVEESAWIEELELQGSAIATQAPPAGFDEAGLHEQLAVIRPLLDQSDIDVLAWISLDPHRAHLSIAFVGDGRAQLEVLDLPRDDAVASALALATRAVVAEVLAAPGPPTEGPAPVPAAAPTPSPWTWQLTAGATLPVTAEAGGPRAGGDAELAHTLAGPLALGAAVGAQGNAHHLRAGPRFVVRVGPALLAAGVDVAALEWITWAQPRLELGLRGSVRDLVVETRLRYAPQRDEVRRGEVLYDSGRVELGLHLGLSRQIHRR